VVGKCAPSLSDSLQKVINHCYPPPQSLCIALSTHFTDQNTYTYAHIVQIYTIYVYTYTYTHYTHTRAQSKQYLYPYSALPYRIYVYTFYRCTHDVVTADNTIYTTDKGTPPPYHHVQYTARCSSVFPRDRFIRIPFFNKKPNIFQPERYIFLQ